MINRHDLVRLEQYLDGELSPAETASLLSELKGSPELSQELKLAQQLKRLLQQFPETEPRDGYFDEVTNLILARTTGVDLDPIEIQPEYVNRNRYSVVRVFVPVAAALILFFGALSLSSNLQRQTPVVMPVAEYEALSLSDSTTQHDDVSWDLAAGEASDMAIGISAVGAPGRATGFASLSDMITVRWR